MLIMNYCYFSMQEHALNNLLDQPVQTPIAQLARQALLKELCLTPKPGLVDMNNSGAHRDMDFNTFIVSINRISVWFDEFYWLGTQCPHHDSTAFLPLIRKVGIKCEQAMFAATQQVNTHKGGIFTFALLLSAIGRIEARRSPLNIPSICAEVVVICGDIVDKELTNRSSQQAQTVGEQLFFKYGLTGARGEAASGYATVRNIALPIYLHLRQHGITEDKALLHTLLHLLAYNNDTNLVSRGGMAGLQFAQQQALILVQQDAIAPIDYKKELYALDQQFIERNLSPGGSADLLAITWFLAQFA